MTHKIAEATPSSAVATSGTITFSYPDGTTAGDYATFGHKIWSEGLQAHFSQDLGTISVSFGASNITVTYKGTTSIPANTRVSAQFNQRGAGVSAPPSMVGMQRMTYAPVVRIDLGTPDTADPDGICTSQSASGAHTLTLNGAYVTDGVAVLDVPRNIVVDSGGADTAVLTITGTDEYGDVVVEAITLNGTTAVAGKKAFKTVTSITASATISNGAFVGTGDVFGLPVYLPATTSILASIEDNVPTYAFGYDGDATGDPVAVSHLLAGTAVAGVQTTPTSTTGDVRGTWDPTTAADGAKAFGLLVVLTDPTYRGVDNYDG
jgi:hypothetical protein